MCSFVMTKFCEKTIAFLLGVLCLSLLSEKCNGQIMPRALNASNIPMTISSPNYPRAYPNNIKIQWTITASEGRRIIFTFQAGNMELDYDFVDIFENQKSLGRITGADLEGRAIISDGNSVTVTFRSDDAIVREGFLLSYRTATCGRSFTVSDSPQAFSISHRNLANSNCFWIINSDNGKSFDVRLGQGLLADSDFVEIFDGIESRSNQSGTIQQFDLTTYRTVRVHFRSSSNNPNLAGLNVTFQNSVCGSNLTADETRRTFSTPFYPRSYSNGLSCEWNIAADRFIILVFFSGSTEDCCDKVQVNLGDASSHTFSGEFSPGTTLVARSGQLRVTFQSDRRVQASGFLASYEKASCVREVTVGNVSETLIFSNSDGNCVWILRARPGEQIQFEIASANLTPMQSIEIFDNDASENLTNTIKNRIFISTYGILRVYFRADAHMDAGNVRAVVRESCGVNVDIAPSQILNITSPGWPMDYSNNLRCAWFFETSRLRKVQLQIVQLEIQTCCDHLQVRNGENNTMVTTAMASSFIGPRLRVTFNTDRSDVEQGFRLVAQQASCDSTLEATFDKQQLESFGWPIEYPNASKCEWTIFGDGNITLQLLEVDMEECCDYIEVFSGNNLLGRFNQTRTILTFTSSANENFRIRLSSDPAVTGKGFRANYFLVSNDEEGSGFTTESNRELITATPVIDFRNQSRLETTTEAPLETTTSRSNQQTTSYFLFGALIVGVLIISFFLK